MIHRHGMLQLLECDRLTSSQVNVFRLVEVKGAKEAAEIVGANFDGVVFTFSNIIRPGAMQDSTINEFLRHLKVPFFCVGIGLQDTLGGGVEQLDADMAEMLHILNERAALFAVRGKRTLEWCRSAGFSRAIDIGCPSMFVYPTKIAGLEAPVIHDDMKLVTGGHLHPTLTKMGEMSMTLVTNFCGWDVSYVFQGELAAFTAIHSIPGGYDEAIGAVNVKVVNDFLLKKTGQEMPFKRYYEFNDPWSWRQCALQHDAYLGGRIHGGVTAMQAGRPSLVYAKDVRISELVTYHGIPSCSAEKFAKNGVRRSLEEYLNQESMSRFRTRYIKTLKKFIKTLNSVGLSMANRRECENVIKSAAMVASPLPAPVEEAAV